MENNLVEARFPRYFFEFSIQNVSCSAKTSYLHDSNLFFLLSGMVYGDYKPVELEP